MKIARRELPDERGFGLVETLIATAIIATMAAATFAAIAANARATQLIVDRRTAVMLAQSALDLGMAGIGNRREAQGQTVGTLAWSLSVEPYRPRTDTAPPIDRVTVTVRQSASGRAILRLSSLKLGQ